jgi:hypothetical protein
MNQFKDDPKVDGLLFNFLSFYGSYDFVADSYDWVRREVRILKNNKAFYSYGDALGFRKNDNEKLKSQSLSMLLSIIMVGFVRLKPCKKNW